MWVVGIDEAGYGPNLGPLVQSAVAFHIPDGSADVWDRLSAVACRATCESPGDRLVIDDSKAVYQGNSALAQLERVVWSVFRAQLGRDLLSSLDGVACTASLNDLAAEPWFEANDPLPVAVERDLLNDYGSRWHDAIAAARIKVEPPCCVITPAPRFNEVLREGGSKGAVTGRGVISLIGEVVRRTGDEPVLLIVDKLGGRNFYAPMLQTALPDCWITPIQETGPLSEYATEHRGRRVRVQFKPRAESEAMPVALASMLSKYLREVLMRQFNRYWLNHMPGVKPTAGYPGDAKRFFDEIQPAVVRLGLCNDAIWRRR